MFVVSHSYRVHSVVTQLRTTPRSVSDILTANLPSRRRGETRLDRFFAVVRSDPVRHDQYFS